MEEQLLGRKRLEQDARRIRTLIPQFVPLTSALTSTSWNGDAYSTTAKTAIDLSTVFGAPAGIRAVNLFVQIRDSGSAAGDPYLILSPENGAGTGHYVRAAGLANDSLVCDNLVCSCDASGDLYYQINATGAGTMDVWLEIWGYWL